MASRVQVFQNFLRPAQILTDQTLLGKYNLDYTRLYRGASKLALLPETTEQVSRILEICDRERWGVMTVGGNTSLVAGATPEKDEIILSTEKMRHFEFCRNTKILTCEAGVVLQTVQESIGELGYETPYNLGARGSCTVCGNVSTNAGGINFVKYGSLRKYVTGLEVVLASGKVLNLLDGMPKDNTGLDFKHLFIGTEGTLGVITKCQVQCSRSLPLKRLLLLRIQGFDRVPKIARESKEILGNRLCALEYFDGRTFQMAKKNCGFDDPFDPEGAMASQEGLHFMMVEFEGDEGDNLDQYLEKFADRYEGDGIDILVYQEGAKRNAVWEFREGLVEHLLPEGKLLKYDLSVRPEEFQRILEKVEASFGKEIKTVTNYGHIGDGNVHLQVILDRDKANSAELKKRVDEVVYQAAIELGGSISAEHGVGQIKRPFLRKMKGEHLFGKMVDVKRVFDPNNTLNPGKIYGEI